MEKEEAISLWLRGDLSQDELQNHVNASEIEEYQKILATVDNWRPAINQSDYLVLSDVLSAPEKNVALPFYRRPAFMAVAASLVLICSLVFLFMHDQEEVFYAVSKNKIFTLPDQSTIVTLAPGGRLSYSGFDSDDRKVRLSGRAFFDIPEKGPFSVEYAAGKVEVLGTQFEVNDLDNYLEITCFEGRVAVVTDQKTIELSRGEKASYFDDKWLIDGTSYLKPLWISGQGERFENAPLLKVIQVLEKRFKIKIDTNKINLERRFTGMFGLEDISRACQVVFSPLGIKFQIEGERIILSE
ncbi:MAG: FecR domain-containing protein [Bacteroidota bacterium]